MSSYGGQNSNRNVDDPRNYRVRLSRFGSHAPGDFKPSPDPRHDLGHVEHAGPHERSGEPSRL